MNCTTANKYKLGRGHRNESNLKLIKRFETFSGPVSTYQTVAH